ncbi:ABC transporter permease [Parasulfuritortus cantonensis]|uniref:ABC transporter permease n=1 Tax=Parasulfuritortus cantonensis TaxID=2528202 RepID=A0A4R1B5D7_9PROT|nr:ABC transporter permease [Parasulfuritortus cantonensis]TCJ13191.1 ABC transporter permease [Parasulfuritortus cantonensis]
MPVLLWTDALIFLLVAGLAGFAYLVRRHPHLAVPWRRVAADPLAMAAAVVLLCFTAVAVLDSLHYRPALPPGPNGEAQYAAEVNSVLDRALAVLVEHQEKSYSAPFATRLFAKEAISLPDGRTVRDYPRLAWGGAHLADPDRGRAGDIAGKAGLGLALGLAAWLPAAWLVRRRLAAGGARRAVLATLLAVCLVAGVLAVLAPYYHVFGTDKVGQDVLYATIKSIRTGVLIGALTTLVTLPLAIGLGVSAGYFGGRVDDAVQYLYTTLNSIPGVLLIAAAVLLMQAQLETHPDWFETGAERADLRLLFLCLILGMTNWTGLARLLRAETLKVRELDYVIAARAFGVSDGRILTRHILPNVQHIVLISVVMDFSGLVLAEAVLSYVGVGVDPGMMSFGNMINGARLELAREPVVWWQLVAAFLFMFVLVLAANLFADSVRDALDPRTRSRT